MPLSPLIEHNVTVHEFNYAVQCWGDPSHTPIIALHGWLDNSESFSKIAEHLDNVYLIAPDLAGHGLTDQRTAFAEYSLWSEVNEICAIADALGLAQFALLGHSRGAMMAHVFAAIVPERVTKLILLDSIIPIPVKIDQLLPRLHKRYKSVTQLDQMTRFFDDKDSAILARCQSDYGGISRDNAERLAKRGVSERNGTFFWHADSKLKVLSGIGLSAEQIQALLFNVSAPTLMLIAARGLMVKQQDASIRALVNNVIQTNAIAVKTVDGDHFLHMSDSSANIAKILLDFINTSTTK